MNTPFVPNYIDRATMRQYVSEIAAFVATDKHGNLRRVFHRLAVDSGLLDVMPFDPDNPPSFPTLADLTAIQVALFDNWPKGRALKSKPYRYAVTLNGWTIPAKAISFAKRNWQVKANATLFTGEQLAAKVPALKRKSLRNPISDEYANILETVAANIGDDPAIYAGPLFAKGGQNGTTYFDETFVVLRIDEGVPSAPSLYRTGCPSLGLDQFVAGDASGKPLKGSATHQSRTASDALLARWRSR